MKYCLVRKPPGPLTGRIELPASKSISNRLLIIRALSGEHFSIEGLSPADDTILLTRLLREIQSGKRNGEPMELDTGNAGTVMRFLTAFLAISDRKWILTGSERMKQRPVSILVDALNALGGAIDYLGRLGNPPLVIRGRKIEGGEITIDGSVSSQYCSALLMIAPYLPAGLTVRLRGPGVSSPYITMTVHLMKAFGAKVKQSKHVIRVMPGRYTGHDYRVEPDWSAAAFWYEAAALSGDADLFLEGLDASSIQGDAILHQVYRNFGVTTEFTGGGARITTGGRHTDGYFFDFTDYPDIAPPVIATCAGLGIRGRFEGLKSLKIKETDRLVAMKTELTKLGVHVEASDSMNMPPSLELLAGRMKPLPGISIETYGDHRMAMTFAPMAVRLGSIRINRPEVVVKSYPSFWEHLQQAGFEVAFG